MLLYMYAYKKTEGEELPRQYPGILKMLLFLLLLLLGPGHTVHNQVVLKRDKPNTWNCMTIYKMATYKRLNYNEVIQVKQ